MFGECPGLFYRKLWNERVNAEPARRPDLHAGAWRGDAEHEPREYPATVVLLIVGGNDTTRNYRAAGSVWFFKPEPGPSSAFARQSRPDRIRRAGNHPLPDAARLHAPHRAGGLRKSRRQDDRAGDKVMMWYIRATATRNRSRIP